MFRIIYRLASGACWVRSWAGLSCVLLSLSAGAEVITEINVQVPSSGTGETFISGFSFYNKKVTYDNKHEKAIFEGDVILGSVAEAESWRLVHESYEPGHVAPSSVIITGDRFRWINNLIPYRFGTNVSSAARNMALQAMDHWRVNTAVDFVERNASNASNYPDYVTIVSDEFACWSFVGRRGGEQVLNVVDACGFGGMVHELGHAVGLWHEQSREDRDNFVQINWANIQVGQEHNFRQHINDGDDVGLYDYGSIMHYGAFAFSANGQPTITPLQPVSIGQRDGLSQFDIASIFQNYPEIIPVAVLDKSSYSIFLGNSVRFDGSHSFDPNGGVLTYLWDLGDGTTGTGNSAFEHVYGNRGAYAVSLTVSDPDGNTNTAVATANVYGFEAMIPVITLLL